MAKRKLVEVEGLAGADADLRELGANILLVRSGRGELQGEVETFEEIALHELLGDRGEVDERILNDIANQVRADTVNPSPAQLQQSSQSALRSSGWSQCTSAKIVLSRLTTDARIRLPNVHHKLARFEN